MYLWFNIYIYIYIYTYIHTQLRTSHFPPTCLWFQIFQQVSLGFYYKLENMLVGFERLKNSRIPVCMRVVCTYVHNLTDCSHTDKRTEDGKYDEKFTNGCSFAFLVCINCIDARVFVQMVWFSRVCWHVSLHCAQVCKSYIFAHVCVLAYMCARAYVCT